MGWLHFFSTPTAAQLARRKREELRRVSMKPRIGATIFCSDLRMSVQAGMSIELWRFLASRGWRELDDPSRRQRLRALPSTAVMALFDAPQERWDDLLAKAIKYAIHKPTIESAGARVAA
jgi:hypothetical protein